MNNMILGTALEIVGILLILMGIVIRYRINRRRYNKRFEPMKAVSFERKWMGDLGDGFTEFLSIACIVVGIIVWIFGWTNNDHVKAKQVAAQHHKAAVIP